MLNDICDNIYVINIGDNDRILKTREVLSDFEFSFFNGVDGSKLEKGVYENYLKNRKPNSHRLTKGNYGCTMSHINLYKKIYDGKLNNTLILEDDNIICQNIDNSIINRIKECNSDIIFFGLTNVHVNYDLLLDKHKPLYNMTKENFISLEGTNAYLIKDYKLALELYHFNLANLYTADGALMEFLKKKNKRYSIIIPQIFKQSGSSLITNIDKKYD